MIPVILKYWFLNQVIIEGLIKSLKKEKKIGA